MTAPSLLLWSIAIITLLQHGNMDRAEQKAGRSAGLEGAAEHHRVGFALIPSCPPVVTAVSSQANHKVCTIDQSQGIKIQGQVLRGWLAVKDAGVLSVTSFINKDIPGTAQNKSAASAAACNCRCNSITQCVGYTWLGSKTQQCWLHSYIDWSVGFSRTYLDWNNNTQAKVASDAIVARVVKDTDWPMCSLIIRTVGALYLNSSSDGIKSPNLAAVNSSACNQACGNDPHCIGYQWSQRNVSDSSERFQCQLYSSFGGLVEHSHVITSGATSVVAVLNNCLEDLPATSASLLPSFVVVPPLGPAPPPPNYLAPSSPTGVNKCGIDGRPGIRYQGLVWKGFTNQLDAGAATVPVAINPTSLTPSDLFQSSVSSRFIDPKVQGQPFSDPQDCNCQCATISNCVGYTWLGDTTRCWLHSWIDFAADPADHYHNHDSGQPDLVQVPANTVSGRVVRHNGTDAMLLWNQLSQAFGTNASANLTCHTLLSEPRSAPKTPSSDRITMQPSVPVTPTECNAACLLDPYCVGYTWSGLNSDEKAVCALLSNITGGLVDVPAGAATQNFTAVVQTCLGDALSGAGLTQTTAPAAIETSCGVSFANGVWCAGVTWPGWVPVYGYGGDLTATGEDAPQASNAFIADDVQGKATASPDECNCRCASVDACIAWTWLGGDQTECWLHSAVNYAAMPMDMFLDPNNVHTSDMSMVPMNTVVGRVVLPPGSPRLQGCGEQNHVSILPVAQLSGESRTILQQPEGAVTVNQCNDLCLQQPKCTAFLFRKQDTSKPDTTQGSCELSTTSYGYQSNLPALDSHAFAAPVQACSSALTDHTTASKNLSLPVLSNTTTAAQWTAGIRYTGVVWPGWQRAHDSGWKMTDGTGWSDTGNNVHRRLQAIITVQAWSNNYIPDDQQGLKAASPEDNNKRCASINTCIAYTWLGGSIKECWLHSWVQFWQPPVATYLDANGLKQPVPPDTIVARVIKSDWAQCKQQMSWFSKLKPVSGSFKGITRPNPVRASDVSTCNAECSRDPACIGFSFQGPVPVDGSPVNCVLYSNITDGLTFNSSRTGISYTVPLQACLQDLLSTGPSNPMPMTPPGVPGTTSPDIPTPEGQPVGGTPSVTGPSTPAAQQSSFDAAQSDSASGKRVTTIAVAVAASLGLLLLVAGGYVWWRQRRHAAGDSCNPCAGCTGSKKETQKIDVESPRPRQPLLAEPDFTSASVLKAGLPMGLLSGDPFVPAARQLSWIDYLRNSNTTWVESGINDTQLDKLSQDGTCPAVELKAADMGQIELLTNGLIGKGGAALVFACRWPSRFGPDALLAVKVLRSAYDASEVVLQSFSYEANLLASIRSPHVVKLYGYCLELPVVALIMELLPTSLESLLHPTPQQAPFYLTYMNTALGHAHSPVAQQAVTPTFGHLSMVWATNTSSSSKDAPSMSMTSSSQRASPVVIPSQSGGSTSEAARSREVLYATSAHTTANDHHVLSTPSMPTSPASTAQHATSEHALRLASDAPATPSTVAANAGRSTLSMLSVLQITADVAAGLAYLHNRTVDSIVGRALPEVETTQTDEATCNGPRSIKIVHRDLKPANLLINSCGQAKIVDFGLAREFATTTMHTMHAGAGTLLYMAPELLASRVNTGTMPFKPTYLVDIYSLGILMWEMLSQQKPWQDMNMAQLVAAVCGQQRPPIPSAESPTGKEGVEGNAVFSAAAQTVAAHTDLASTPAGFGIVHEFDNLIRQCWQHRDHKRPQAADVHKTLQQLLDKAQQQSAQQENDT